MESREHSPDVSATGEDSRPSQGPFSDEEKEYLLGYLDDYLASSSSSAHGEKSKWVKLNVYPKFIDKFGSAGPGGPNLATLRVVSLVVQLENKIKFT
jgi:hypothetical protein